MSCSLSYICAYLTSSATDWAALARRMCAETTLRFSISHESIETIMEGIEFHRGYF